MFHTMLERIRSFFTRLRRNRKGAALVEYAMLVGGIALICIVAVTFIGHKTNDILASVAAILPGAHTDDNGAFVSGQLVETTLDANNRVVLDVNGIVAAAGTKRLGNNLGVDLTNLVVQPGP